MILSGYGRMPQSFFQNPLYILKRETEPTQRPDNITQFILYVISYALL